VKAGAEPGSKPHPESNAARESGKRMNLQGDFIDGDPVVE
jgi:hypothetical protein